MRQPSSAVIGCSIQDLGDGKSHSQSERLIYNLPEFLNRGVQQELNRFSPVSNFIMH